MQYATRMPYYYVMIFSFILRKFLTKYGVNHIKRLVLIRFNLAHSVLKPRIHYSSSSKNFLNRETRLDEVSAKLVNDRQDTCRMFACQGKMPYSVCSCSRVYKQLTEL